MLGLTSGEINTFITQSNAIENIFEPADHPLVVNHKKAVKSALKNARRGITPDLLAIHAILLQSEPHKNPGRYRTIRMTVGRNKTPPPELVPDLMMNLLDFIGKGPKAGEDIEQWIWNIHHEFECIHPFVDGNGRTGRILMNAMRLNYGLPWLTIFEKEKYNYYHKIASFRWENPRYRQYSATDHGCDVETLC